MFYVINIHLLYKIYKDNVKRSILLKILLQQQKIFIQINVGHMLLHRSDGE